MKKVLPLALVIFFPLLSNIFLIFFKVELVLINYLNIFIFSFFVIKNKGNKKTIYDNTILIWIINFNILFVLINFINSIILSQNILYFLGRNYAHILCLPLIFYLQRVNAKDFNEIWYNISLWIGIIFLTQLFFSVLFSLYNIESVFDSFDWSGTRGGIISQDIYDISGRIAEFYFTKEIELPFQLVFTGLLGQHNHWGTQLPFYNLIFLYNYFQGNSKKFYFILICLVTFAIVFNTSRFGIIAVIVTDVFFLFLVSQMGKKIKKIILFLICFLFISNYNLVTENIERMYELSSSFRTRENTWVVIEREFYAGSLYNILFGSSADQISQMRQKLVWEDFENLSYQILFEEGLIVFLIFIFILLKIIINAFKLSKLNKFTALFVVVNIIFVSAWSNVFFRYSSYLLAILTLLGVYGNQTNLNKSQYDQVTS